VQELTAGDPRWIGRDRRFAVLARLGNGGMGRVYLARSVTAEQVAVKIILPHLLSDETIRRRFAAEVAGIRQAQGIRIAQFRGADLEADPPWLATEYVPGRNLRQHVEARGPLDTEPAAALGAMLAEGLRTVHEAGLLHRDLKPANIMLGQDGPRIIDLGLAVLQENDDPLTATGQVTGTAAYMAPEQAAGSRDLTPAVDVYALGAVLLFASTGRHPYPAAAAHVVAAWVADSGRRPDTAGLSPALRPLIEAMLAHDRQDRPRVDEILDGFSSLAAPGDADFRDIRAAFVRRTYDPPSLPGPPALSDDPIEPIEWSIGPTELVDVPPTVRPRTDTGSHREQTQGVTAMTDGARLRVLMSAEKEIMKLSRSDVGAVYEFQHKFRTKPDSPGLHLKKLKGDDRLWSARVNAELRAVLLNLVDRDFLLIDVKHRKEVYDDLSRYAYRVNKVTGALEVIDLEPVDAAVLAEVQRGDERRPLFAAFADDVLVGLGVAEPLLDHVRELRTEEELLLLVDQAPQLTVDVLFALYDGKSVEQVRAEITDPVRADDAIDPDDLAAAAARPATEATTDDADMRAVLGGSFERWQVFLHPTQRRLVERSTTGATRVGGGPGTGKTIVALHRVAHLADRLEPGDDRPILLTTFNRNLANDLQQRLLTLGGEDLARRIDVIHIDRLAMRLVAGADPDSGRELISDARMVDYWQSFLTREGIRTWTADFLAAEWAEVILGQMLMSVEEYVRARRPGRGKPLGRDERRRIWQVTQRFSAWLKTQPVWTWRQVAAQAAVAEMNSAAEPGHRFRYRHVVVDEAQDLSAAHWRMLRAMVPVGPDDMFLTGDAHQRIYGNHVTLSTVGINIRGRSHLLTLSYRTTREILATALELMTGESVDDLDGEKDTLAGYRSLLHGRAPLFRGTATWEEEQQLIVAQAKAWSDLPGGSVAVCLPTRDLAATVLGRLRAEGVDAVEISPDGPVRPDGVHVGTINRFKGQEYRRMIIAAVTEGIIPSSAIQKWQDVDPKRYQLERLLNRSKLFVAVSRARDELAVFWHGTPSSFLAPHLTR
jgi:serine/threonine protein kinase/superfamily I DNA/RNA helicase